MSQSSLKVLYISHSHPPDEAPLENMGGMQRVSMQLVQALVDNSTVEIQTIIQKAPWKGIEWRTLLFLLKLRRQIPQVIDSFKPDVILFSSMVTASMARWLKGKVSVPMVTINHGQDVTMPYGWYQKHVSKVLDALDGVISVSQATRQACIDRGMDPGKGVALPNGIQIQDLLPMDADYMNPAHVEQLLVLEPTEAVEEIKVLKRAAKKELGVHVNINLLDKPVLLSVGRQVPRKGHAWFIEKVLTQLNHPCHYLLVGDGPERETILTAIHRNAEALAERHIHVHILGRKSDYWVHKAYTAADVFMMPNVKVEGDMEGFGIVLLEANLHFTPVFCSDLEGMKDVVEQGVNGFKVKSERQMEYVKELERLLSSDSLLPLSLMGCRYVWENFQWDKVAEQYIQYLIQVNAV